ncbi:MAG: class I SAM-dependent methyltransferase [Pseudonocardiaceae bacterium]
MSHIGLGEVVGLMAGDAVVEHYSQGALEKRILDALTLIGVDPERLDPDQLAPVDEFHIGGRLATVELVDQLKLRAGLRVLDVGSGLGGAARYMVRTHGVEVVGVDLTEEYVRVASSLTRRSGLADSADFHQGSATDLPFTENTFDRACMLHVGMNIVDKAAVFREVRRVLADGGSFGVYDIMQTGSGELSYPLPWAATPHTNFLASPQRYRELLSEAGLPVEVERDRGEFAIGFLRGMLTKIAESEPPPLGLHLVMGQDALVKIKNMYAGIEHGTLTPVEMVCAAR